MKIIFYAVPKDDEHMHLRIELDGFTSHSWSSSTTGLYVSAIAYLDRCSEYREDPSIESSDDLVFQGFAIETDDGITIMRQWFVPDIDNVFACGWIPGDVRR